MITIFATPKNFTGIYSIIQTNALKSWRALSSEIQIIIFGDSKGSKKIANEINAEYIPNVRCSPQGTPFLSDMFLQAEKLAKYSILTFINADIILPNNFLSSIKICSLKYNKFLMVSYRWDMDVTSLINFNSNKEIKQFWEKADDLSIKHACTGIDYFVYRKSQWGKLPDFIIGRPGYDNWLIWRARRKLIPVIDGTNQIKVVHQNHDYKFHNIVADPKKNPEPEGISNKKIIGGNTLNLMDCNFELIDNKVIKKRYKTFVLRNLHRLPKIFPEAAKLIKIYRRIYKKFYE